MTGLTLITALVLLLAVSGRISYGQALALGAATPAGAALIVGGFGVPTYDAVAVGVAGVLGLAVLGLGSQELGRRERLPPGALLLLLFLGWSVLVTLTAPLMFDGLRLVHPTSFELVAGSLTKSNVAQLGYLALGIAVVVYLTRAREAGPQLLGLALGLPVILSLARYLAQQTGLPFPEGLFDSSPTSNFIETDSDGSERVRGILSEPAGLASVCLLAIAYFAARSADVRGIRRAGCVAVVAIALYLGIISTSATFVVAGLITGGLFAATGVIRFAARRARMDLLVGMLVSGAIVGIALVAPRALAFIDTTIEDKVDSDSFSSRTSADSLSMGVFLDTLGYGVGLGSARGSSVVPTLLASVGVVGALLLVVAIATIVVAGIGKPGTRPVVAALVALLVVKLVSSPDLSSSTLWLGLGLLARAGMDRPLTWRGRRADETVEGGGEPEGSSPRPYLASRSV